ncbi:MAG: GNAT family N-acetyltransferase [Tannerellaceae bacterium]|jgi:ribosomal protein S18 acetylase RimI-like enzyme|nr:GNAT family N-acetyltransferase [Tannerellaceae bacterium]
MTASANSITVAACDLSDMSHRKAVADLINAYIMDEMGGGTPLTEDEQVRLTDGLGNHPSAIILLAAAGDGFVGLLVAFENFSTFTARPMINIHDVMVLPGYRGQGVGRRLLDAIVEEAARRHASRITLEVRQDNVVARNLYKSLGFASPTPDMYYWRKYLE